MTRNLGKERGAAIGGLEQHIAAARARLDNLGELADFDELSFERRDELDLECGVLRREIGVMTEALALLKRDVPD